MYNVMIVDDESSILTGLKGLLNWEEYGLEIVALCVNPVDALDILKETDVHILITDIRMPVMSGLDLIVNAQSFKPEIRTIILSGYDDFAYVKEALKIGVENYLLKPISVDELTQTIQGIIKKLDYRQGSIIKAKDVYRENLLNRWVSNSAFWLDIKEKAKIIDLNLTNNEYAVVVASLNKLSDEPDRRLLCYHVSNRCVKLVNGYLDCITFVDTDFDIVMVFSANEVNKYMTDLRQLLLMLEAEIKTAFGVGMFITIGKTCAGYKNVYASYDSAKDMQHYSLMCSMSTILDTGQIMRFKQPLRSISFDLDEFNVLLTANNVTGCTRFLQRIQSRAIDDKVSLVNIKYFMMELVYHLTKAIKLNLGRVSLEAMKADFMDSFSCDDIDLLFSQSLSLLRCYFTLLEVKEQKINPIVKRLIAYVQTHYAEDISLKTLADKFSMNSSYLGQLFKSEVGDVFTNYLNTVRVDKAKELLRTTHINITEIAKQTGYTSQCYFFTVFKKACGISPAEYRNGQKNT